jgi:hypothetical protein
MQDGHYRGGKVVHTGQLFFTEATSLAAMTGEAYQRHGLARTTLAEDNVYASQHGDASIAVMSREGDMQVATLTLAVDPSATSRESMR